MKINSKTAQAFNTAILMLVVGSLIMYTISVPNVGYLCVACYAVGHFMGRWTAPD